VLQIQGTRASALRPGRASAGPVWDALALPVLALPRPAGRIAILGLGGGTVARLLRALAPEARIVGIERDPEVIRAARAAFGLEHLDLEVVVGDALDWLRRERRSFDVVIEDLFVGSVARVRKPDFLPEHGLRLARERLGRHGILCSNTIHEGAAMARTLRRLFPEVRAIHVAGHYNRILVAGRYLPDARRLRALARAEPLLRGGLRRLSFRTLR
jgi:spermidine synthase